MKYSYDNIDPIKLREELISELSKLPETVLREMVVTDKAVEAKINEFAELSDEIDRIEMNLKSLQSKFKSLEKELRPVIEALDDLNESALVTKKYIMTIKKKGYEKDNPKYKEAFNLALTKVNTNIRTILQECLAVNTTSSQVASQLAIQARNEIVEGIFDVIKERILNVINRAISTIKKSMNNIDNGVMILAKLAK